MIVICYYAEAAVKFKFEDCFWKTTVQSCRSSCME